MKWYFYNRVIKKAYRNKKREVAIWLLEKISKQNRGHISGTGIGIDEAHKVLTTTDESIVDPYFLHELQTQSGFTKEIIKDAVLYLENAGYAEKVDKNNTDYYKQRIQITKNGIAALNDEVIEDEIMIYKNDLFYSYLRWWLPIAAIFISVLSLCITTCKKSNGNNIPAQRLNLTPTPIDTNQKKGSSTLTGNLNYKADSSHANSGQ